MKKLFLPFCLLLLMFSFVAVSCDDNDDENEPQEELVGLESPYLICASRNPGGVGFDFKYEGQKGVAYNIDNEDDATKYNSDIVFCTVKGEKSGKLKGAPFIKLSRLVTAVNYSSVDPTCKGIIKFNALNSSNVQSYNLEADNASFDIDGLTNGDLGKPMLSDLQAEYTKLVIGQTWKSSANNDVTEDELIWIIETSEGQLVKLIVSDFPAAGASTETGYVAINWDYLD